MDLPFNEWDKVEKSKIYITTPRLVHNTFYKLLCGGDVYNSKIKMSEKEGIVRFQYNNKNLILYNPDYHVVKKTINTLNEGVENPKYSFNNQRLHMIAREVLDKDFGGVPMSTMNKSGHFIFHSEFIRNCQFNGWPQS